MFRKKTVPTTQQMGLLPVILALLLVRCSASAAAEAGPSAQYAIEQPSQPVAESLQAIAHETMMKDGAVVVRPATMPGVAPAVPGSGVPASTPSAEAVPGNDVDTRATADSARDDSSTVAKVEITGSRLKRINAEGPAPVNVYTAKDIEQSGQPNLERFLAGLNEVSASAGEGAAGATGGQGTVQLRGLPLGTTLVLINGRRVEAVGSSSANYFNLNLIPMAAIDRVEIVPVGSSAVYGGDALAGVVNVILKKSMDGVSLSANLGSGRGFGGGGLSLATGGRGADESYGLLQPCHAVD